MNQLKIGEFLKKLRNEKHLTQEQLAEHLNVARRTISRWETGSNLPDLSILLELADFYEVELRELLDGERKSEQMNKELKETVEKVVDYSNAEKEKFAKRMHTLSIVGLISLLVYTVMIFSDTNEHVSSFFLGFATVLIAFGVLASGRYGQKLNALKSRILRAKSNKESR